MSLVFLIWEHQLSDKTINNIRNVIKENVAGIINTTKPYIYSRFYIEFRTIRTNWRKFIYSLLSVNDISIIFASIEIYGYTHFYIHDRFTIVKVGKAHLHVGTAIYEPTCANYIKK